MDGEAMASAPADQSRRDRARALATDLALAVAVALAALTSYQDWRQPTVIALGLATAAAAFVVRRTPWPLAALAVVGWVWVGMWPAIPVTMYAVGAGLQRGRQVLACTVAAAVLVAAPALVGGVVADAVAPSVSGVVNIALLIVGLVLLPVAVGRWVAARRQVLEGLRQQADQLLRERSAVAERERALERSRISREMHDVVAHRVSLMVIQAGALEVKAADPDVAASAERIRTLGRDALADLRDVLGVLRSTRPEDAAVLAPPPGLDDLDRLLEESRAAGLPVERHDEGTPRPLPRLVESAAYRVVQEALTNVHRHAGQVRTQVRLRHDPDQVEVRVLNAPPLHPRAGEQTMGAGAGLLGLRERVSLLGGELTAGPQPGGGFAVTAVLPTTRPTESA